MTSSMKKGLVSRAHKERAQPKARAKRHGLLEKHKDYVLRARDFNAKKARIQLLKEKAALRNPDEFYYAMHNAKTVKGKHVSKRKDGAELDPATVALMKSQDRGYIAMQLAKEKAAVEKLQEQLSFTAKPQGKHTIFVDSVDEVEDMDEQKLADKLDTAVPFLDTPALRPTKEQIAKGVIGLVKKSKEGVTATSVARQKALDAEREKAYLELSQRLEREKKLAHVQAEMEVEASLAKKGAKVRVRKGTADTAPVYKWKLERKA